MQYMSLRVPGFTKDYIYLSNEGFMKIAHANRIMLVVIISDSKFTVPIIPPSIELGRKLEMGVLKRKEINFATTGSCLD